MKNGKSRNRAKAWLAFGAFFGFSLLIGLIFGLTNSVDAAPASIPPAQATAAFSGPESCQACHQGIVENFQSTRHAQAFSSPEFQEAWLQAGSDPACLACHTTGYDAASSGYALENVTCESCHGPQPSDHPASPMPVDPGMELCATCHQTTKDEWHAGQHQDFGSDCQSCHDPHLPKAPVSASAAQEPTTSAGQETAVPTSQATPFAAPPAELTQGEKTGTYTGPEACQSCHPELYETWQSTRHAQAFSSPIFQRDWADEGSNAYCLECHTTGFDPTTKNYSHEGVTCESCHGPLQQGHPESLMSVVPNADLCAGCHKTTTDEWRASQHGKGDIQCQACHNPHSQQPRAANITELCTNCHKEMEDSFTHGTHANAGLECSNCHMYTGPREGEPIMGLVATGHTFSVGSDTCIGCHQDTVHTRDSIIKLSGEAVATPEITSETLEQKVSEQQMTIQQLEARSSVRLYTGLAQGAIVGLVTGGVAAWVISRRIRLVEEDENEQEEDQS